MSEKRHNPENFSSSEAEITLLRSDLAELFQAQADKTELWVDENWEEPTEVVLAGICHITNDEGEHALEVQIRQRLDAHGVDYLIIVGEKGKYYWVQITDQAAYHIHKGEKPIDSGVAAAMRFYIRDGATIWSNQEARQWAMRGGMYEQADIHAQRDKK